MNRQARLRTLVGACVPTAVMIIVACQNGSEHHAVVQPISSRPSDDSVSRESALTDQHRHAYEAMVAEMKMELPRDLGFRVGMTVAEVAKYVAENNERVDALDRGRTAGVPAFAYRDRHLYVFIDASDSSRHPDGNEGGLTYLVNGRHQCWLDMAVRNGKITNIYVTPGNMTWLGQPFLLAGSGEHVGLFTNRPG